MANKTKKIWTVIWSHDKGHCVVREDTTEPLQRFLKERDARAFCDGLTLHGEPAEPFCEDVPVHIARRWGL